MVGFLHEEVPFILPIPEYFVVAQMFHFLHFTYRKLCDDLLYFDTSLTYYTNTNLCIFKLLFPTLLTLGSIWTYSMHKEYLPFSFESNFPS